MALETMPITRREAQALAERWAGYPVKHGPVIFAVACMEGRTIHGVAIATELDGWARDDWTVMLHLHCASMDSAAVDAYLLEAGWRAARALGYRQMLSLEGNVLYAEGYSEMAARPHVVMPNRKRTIRWDKAMGGRKTCATLSRES